MYYRYFLHKTSQQLKNIYKKKKKKSYFQQIKLYKDMI